MTVWIGYQVYYNYADQFETVVKVFDSEEKAFAWRSEFKETCTDWREYERMEVE